MSFYYLSSYTYINNTGNRSLIIKEPDGSTWLRVFHHAYPKDNIFYLTDYFEGRVTPSQDLDFYVSACNLFTKWELMIKQRGTSTSIEKKYRWVQNVNPMTATFAQVARANITINTSTGYTTPSGSYGGIYYKNNAVTYLSANNGTENNWWGAIGAIDWYQGGIPGYDETVVTDGYIDLYIRTDDGGITSANLSSILNTETRVLKTGSRAWHYNRWPSFTLDSSTTYKSGSATVTTSGRPVFFCISGDLNADSASSAFISVTRWPDGSDTGTQVKDEQVNSPGSSINVPFCLSFLDFVPAGKWTYTYKISRYTGTCVFGEGSSDDAPVITIMEI